MPAVTNTVTSSDGTPAAGTVTVRLLAAGRHTIGHHTTSDYTTGYQTIIQFTGGTWSVTLDRNSDLQPAGSVWELLEEAAAPGGLPRPATRYLATVPAAGTGPFWVGDLLSEVAGFAGFAQPGTATAMTAANGATVVTSSPSPTAPAVTATATALGASVTATATDAYADIYADTYGVVAAGSAGVVLSDNFNDNSTDTGKWATFGTVTETGGQLVCTPIVNVDGWSYSGYQSQQTYALLGSSLQVKVPQVLNDTGGTDETMLIFGIGIDDYLAIFKTGTNLVLRDKSEVTADDTSITYSSSTHAWWRIREQGGTVYWETSPDGTTWTTRRSKVPDDDHFFPAGKVRIMAGQWAAGGSPGTASFDDLNLVIMPAAAPPAELGSGAGTALDATVTATTPGVVTPAAATAAGEALNATVAVSGTTLNPLRFSSATTSTGTAPALACTVPDATPVGAQMLAALYVRAQETITDPAGWTRVNPSGSDGSGQVDDSGMRSVLYQRTAASTDAINTTQYTWTWTSSVKAVIVMAAYGNPHATTPIRAAAAVAEAGTSVTSHTTGSVTPVSNDWLISIFGTTSSSAWTPADTERAEVASTGTSGVSAVLADSNGGVAGGAATRSASQANATSAGAFYLIAVQPA